MSLGMTIRPGTAHYLRLQTKALECRRSKQRKLNIKRKQNDKNFAKLKEQLDKLLADTKEGRQYKPGVALEKEGADKSARKPEATKVCHCGSADHQRTSSKKCPWRGKFPEEVLEMERESHQQALLDCVEVEEDCECYGHLHIKI